jgi:uncharacterized protein YjbI with pentapeptide repeats
MADAKKIDPFDVEALEKSLNDSATRVSTIWVSFLIFSLYLLTAATTVSHRQLFLAEPVKLPVLNIDLPLWGFFWLAPILFVIFHAYVLIQLILLARTALAYDAAVRKLAEQDSWSPEANASLRQRLANTLFAQILAGSPREREGWFGSLLRAMAWITLVIAPVLILLTFQFMFLPYHSHLATWTHRLLVLLEFAVAFKLWPLALDPRRDLRWPSWRWRIGDIAVHMNELFKSSKGRRRTKRRLRRLALPMAAAVLFVILSLSFATFPGEPHVNLFTGQVNLLTGQGLNDVRCNRWIQQRLSFADMRFDRLALARVDVVDHEKLEKIQQATAKAGEQPYQGERTRILRDRDLNCGDFSDYADLRRIDLSGARLKNADFRFAKLEGISLRESQLEGALLNSAQLQGASLEHSQLRRASLDDAQLQAASLKSAQLEGASLDNTGLQGASLERAQLKGASLKSAQLQGAFLNEAGLQDAILVFSQLQRSSLKGAHLQQAVLDFAGLEGASLEGAKLQGASLDEAVLRGASLKGAQLQGASLKSAELGGASFDDAGLQGASLERAQLQGASLKSAQLQGASLDDARLQGAALDSAQLQGASLERAQLQGATLRGTQLQGASLERAQLQGASLVDTQLQGSSLDHIQLQGAYLDNAGLQGAILFGANLNDAILSNVWVWLARSANCDKARIIHPRNDSVGTTWRFGKDDPATRDTIEQFILESTTGIQDENRKKKVSDILRQRLTVDPAMDDIAALGDFWLGCESKSGNVSWDEFLNRLVAAWREAVCDAKSDGAAIGKGVVKNWISGDRTDRARREFTSSVARALLGEDGKPCAPAKDYDKDTKTLLREAAGPPPAASAPK